ncbi:MAG TPA: cytochrome c-type biogenesis protein CcmH [Solirubrobacterales bacterium]
MALALLAVPAPATAGGGADTEPQTTINDVEDEVMCPICGTLLELAESPQAQRERALVKRLIASGKTKAEVKDALVAQYGRDVLALPEGSGFSLSAYLVPAIAFVLAAIALLLGVRRWRRAAQKPPGPGSAGNTGGPEGEDAERLDADLARYDL